MMDKAQVLKDCQSLIVDPENTTDCMVCEQNHAI